MQIDFANLLAWLQCLPAGELEACNLCLALDYTREATDDDTGQLLYPDDCSPDLAPIATAIGSWRTKPHIDDCGADRLAHYITGADPCRLNN